MVLRDQLLPMISELRESIAAHGLNGKGRSGEGELLAA